MADPKQELLSGLHRFVKNRQTVALQGATVTAVDESRETCDVLDADDLEIYDVRLRAATGTGDDGWLLVPEDGSAVLIGNVGNSPSDYAVLAVTKVGRAFCKASGTTWRVDGEGAVIERGTTKIVLDGDGVQIERNGLSLSTVLGQLLDQIKILTVTCTAPGSPSSPPVNLAAFETVKTQLNQILK